MTEYTPDIPTPRDILDSVRRLRPYPELHATAVSQQLSRAVQLAEALKAHPDLDITNATALAYANRSIHLLEAEANQAREGLAL